MRIFGLIGENLTHSFSKHYFKKKFENEGILNCEYRNFEIDKISDFTNLISKGNISGLNVTLPYKEKILRFMDKFSEEARKIGAINVIEFRNNQIIGHNTDYIGFKLSILPLLKDRKTALILGDGGSSKAVKYVLKELNIEYKTISRKSSLNYKSINKEMIDYYKIIINTTPLGMFPLIKDYPEIQYQHLTEKHLLFDLINNPLQTAFLSFGEKKKCEIKNGKKMLEIQAEYSWKIWNS